MPRKRDHRLTPQHAEIPCPLTIILNAPALRTANGGVYRATIVLALSHWTSGCKPLPTDDLTLSAITRLPPGSWRSAKTAVLAALDEISPLLTKAYTIAAEKRANKRRQMLQFVARGTATRTAKARGIPELTQSFTPTRLSNDDKPAANSATSVIGREGHVAASPAEKPQLPAKNGDVGQFSE
jgi:hypothetical protein